MIYSTKNKQKYLNDLDEICGNIHDGVCKSFDYDDVKKEAEVRTYYK